MTDSAALLDWYAANARTLPWRAPPGAPIPGNPDWPYRVWLSEIMLQQTTVAAVVTYFTAFTARWPDVAALAAAHDADVMQAWAGLGYYARARNLLACARAVVAGHDGQFPSDEALLRNLPGIGAYTAAAVAAFGFGRHAIIVDGNIERVVTRLFAIATPLPAARAEIRTRMAQISPERAGDFAQAMMDLARRICTPRNPDCSACPLARGCRAAAAGNAEAFPVKSAKRPRPTRHGTAWWLEAGDSVLTVVRPAKGLLGGMRALPSCDWRGPNAAPPVAGDWQTIGAVTHGFTHFELVLTLKTLVLSEPLAPSTRLIGDWWPIAAIGAAGLPTLFEKATVMARATREKGP